MYSPLIGWPSLETTFHRTVNSPAGGFGAWAPGEATGNYRVGGDILLVDDEGESFISGADFADAVVREIQEPAHRRARFTVGY